MAENFTVESFPEDVARFIETYIESVDQLEALRILATDRDKEWSSATLAREVQSQPERMTQHLDALDSSGLITVTRAPSVTYRYGPRTSELEGKLSRLLQLYNERPVTMIKMVYARPKRDLKTFADAFRLRKEE